LKLNFTITSELESIFSPNNFNDVITAVSNIIDNAAEATKFSGNIDVNIRTYGGDLRILIKDDGPGIPETIKEKIYNKNFTHSKNGGSGLGLYQARNAIHNFQGSLELVENTSSGATFKIFIPNAVQPIDESKTQIKKPAGIVLIDDDKFIRINWARHFKARGITFNSFSTINDFIENQKLISKDFYIYVDSCLSDGSKGEVESQKIYELGFKNIFLSTGYEKSTINKPSWIKDIIPKSPAQVHGIHLS
jgi:anti-sigma regulatory factor (Ser/Thr protein kinase)